MNHGAVAREFDIASYSTSITATSPLSLSHRAATVEPVLDHASALLSSLLKHGVAVELFHYAPNLQRAYAHTMNGMTLPSNDTEKAAFLDHMGTLTIKLLNAHMLEFFADQKGSEPPRSPSSTIVTNTSSYHQVVEAFERAFVSIREIIDRCMTSSHPVKIAELIHHRILNPLIFLELVPLFANKLASLTFTSTPQALRDIWSHIEGILHQGLTDTSSLGNLMESLRTAARIAGLDPDDALNRQWVWYLMAHWVCQHDVVKPYFIDMLAENVARGRVSPAILDAVSSGDVDLLPIGFNRFCRALGVFPTTFGIESTNNRLLRFRQSFSIGQYPFGIDGYLVSRTDLDWVSSLTTNQIAADGLTTTLHLDDTFSVVTVLAASPLRNILAHELWHAFEIRLFAESNDKDDRFTPRAEQIEVIDHEFRAITGSMAYLNTDADNVKHLRELRTTRYDQDVIWEATRCWIVDSFEGVADDDAPAIRARAQQLINEAYTTWLGVAADELFALFRNDRSMNRTVKE